MKMNKIFNWTIGSFFRTIGRTIAFLVMGGLIYYLLSYNGIDIKNLFLEDVKASTYQYQWISGSKWSNDWGSTYNNTSNADGYYFLTDTITSGQNNNSKSYWFKFDNAFNITNQVDSFDVNILMKPTSPEYIAITGLTYRCTEDAGITTCTYTTGSNTNIIENQFGLTLEYFYDNETHFIPCYSKGNSGYIISFTCPISTNKINGFHIVINSLRTMSYTVGHYFGLNFKRDTTQAIIDSQEENTQAVTNQTQQQQQQHQEMMNSTTYDNNETSTIFGDFEDFLPDEGIVTQLITLPISLYTNILSAINGQCQSFSLGSLYGKSLTLPCINLSNYLGSSLWSVIDILMSGFFILVIARKIIKVFENMSSMKEGDVLGD